MPRDQDAVDELIREALASPAGELAALSDEPSMTELLTATFRGRHRRLAIGGAVANLALFVAGVLAAVNFVRADELPTMARWGGVAALCFAGVLAVKIWYWIEMTRLALSREIKRVELQVVQLAGSIERS